MGSERPVPELVADLTTLQQELRELHQRVKAASQQGRKETSDSHEGGMVIRGK